MSGKPDFKAEPRIKDPRAGLAKCLHERRCRVCGIGYGIARHHLVGKGRTATGDDVADNIVPLCSRCHEAIHRGSLFTRTELRESLSPKELAYILHKKGADWLENRYPRRSAEAVQSTRETAVSS